MRILLNLLLLLFVAFMSGCASPQQQQGHIATNISQFENLIDVRLDGATDAPVAEAFGKIVGSAEGVVAAKRYSSRIVPDNLQASSSDWRVTVSGVDAFTLQTNIIDMSRELIRAGGYVTMAGVPYRYSMGEIGLLIGLRPADATSRKLWFVIDRELARDREMSGW